MDGFRLTKSERSLLRWIRGQYPIPVDETKSAEIIAVGERPLPSLADCAAAFPKFPEVEIERLLHGLRSRQLIARLYLHGPGDFIEQRINVSTTVRILPMNAHRAGHDAYQITKYGVEETERAWDRRLTRQFGKVIGKIVDKLTF